MSGVIFTEQLVWIFIVVTVIVKSVLVAEVKADSSTTVTNAFETLSTSVAATSVVALPSLHFETSMIAATPTVISPSTTSAMAAAVSLSSSESVTTLSRDDLTGEMRTTYLVHQSSTSTQSSMIVPETTGTGFPTVPPYYTTVKTTEQDNPTLLLFDIDVPSGLISLVAIGLSFVSCFCTFLFCIGCLHMACKRRKQRRDLEREEALRTATLRRPLGATIRESFAIENPMFKDVQPSMDYPIEWESAAAAVSLSQP